MAHTTNHGNRYTNQEWADKQAFHKAETEANDAIDAKIEKMLNYLRRQCKEFGFSENQANVIAGLFHNGSFAEANIQFSSKKNEVFVNELYRRFSQAMGKL